MIHIEPKEPGPEWNDWKKEARKETQKLIDDANKQGWSKLAVTDAKLQDDNKSVFLSIDKMQAVHQLKLEIDVETKDLEEVIFPVWMTIHALGK